MRDNEIIFNLTAPNYGDLTWGDYVMEHFAKENEGSLLSYKVGDYIEVNYKRRIKLSHKAPTKMEERECKDILFAVYEDKRYFIVKVDNVEIPISFCEVTKF
ncbi:MAG: hypothetical protein K0R54_54 [Clostridiaceae bacterium]|jgi:hypothetical protein|nr:hypothetical protein [Clostridiaceae bacterium]